MPRYTETPTYAHPLCQLCGQDLDAPAPYMIRRTTAHGRTTAYAVICADCAQASEPPEAPETKGSSSRIKSKRTPDPSAGAP
jgi:hypothetical protein